MSESESNLEKVRRGYEAFNAADMQTLTELIAEDAAWRSPGRSSMAGEHRGRSKIFEQFGRYGTETGGTFKANLLDLLESEDGRVVGVHQNTGERTGKTLDVACCIVFEFQDGLLVDGKEHYYDLYAWDEFWS